MATPFLPYVRNPILFFHSSSNPARIILCGQEIVIFREELLARMRRAAVLPPNEDATNGLPQHLTETLIHQAHICPLPLTEAAVYWQLDPSLWLHPAPDVIVVAARVSAYQHTYPSTDTCAFNPGAFATDFAWMVYSPGDRTLAPSSLVDDDE